MTTLRWVWATLAVAALCRAGAAAPVQWPVSAGGNGHWYELVVVPEDISWTKARAAAEARGGYLACVNSIAENQFLYDLSQTDNRAWGQNPVGSRVGPWLGGYQPNGDKVVSNEGWVWVSGELWSYTNWAAGEPNDNQGQPEHYLQFYHRADKIQPTWNDASDELTAPPGRSYLVEYAPLAPVPWSVERGGNGHWYQVVFAPGVSWTRARQAAEAAGGYLACLTSAAENDFVFGMISKDDRCWRAQQVGAATYVWGPWLGGYQPNGDKVAPNEGWVWVNGEPWTYTHWGAGQPDDGGARRRPEHYLIYFHSKEARLPTWNDEMDAPAVGGATGYIVEFHTQPVASSRPEVARTQPAPVVTPQAASGIKSPLWWVERAQTAVKPLGEGGAAMPIAMGAYIRAKMGDVAGFRAAASQIKDESMQREIGRVLPEVLARAGDTAGAKAAALSVKEGYERNEAYTAIAVAQVITGDAAGAKATASEIKDAYRRDLAYGKMVAALIRRGDISGGKAMAAELQDAQEKVPAFCAIALAQAKGGDAAGARQTAGLARTMVPNVKHDEIRTRRYGMVADILLQVDDAAGARQALAAAKAEAVKQTDAVKKALAYCAIAPVEAKLKDFAEARQSFAAARAAIGDIKDGRMKDGVKGDLALAQAKAGDMVGARETAQEIGNGAGEGEAFRRMVIAQLRAGDIAGAKVTAAGMAAGNARPQAISFISAAQAGMGDLEALRDWIGSLTDVSDRVWGYLGAAMGLVEGGLSDEIRSLAD